MFNEEDWMKFRKFVKEKCFPFLTEDEFITGGWEDSALSVFKQIKGIA